MPSFRIKTVMPRRLNDEKIFRDDGVRDEPKAFYGQSDQLVLPVLCTPGGYTTTAIEIS